MLRFLVTASILMIPAKLWAAPDAAKLKNCVQLYGQLAPQISSGERREDVKGMEKVTRACVQAMDQDSKETYGRATGICSDKNPGSAGFLMKTRCDMVQALGAAKGIQLPFDLAQGLPLVKDGTVLVPHDDDVVYDPGDEDVTTKKGGEPATALRPGQ